MALHYHICLSLLLLALWAPAAVSGNGAEPWHATFREAAAAAGAAEADRRAGLLAEIAIAQGRAGDREGARVTVSRAMAIPSTPLPNGRVPGYPASRFAVAQAWVGNALDGLATARRISSASERSRALAETAAALKEAGHEAAADDAFREAVAVARSAAGALEGEQRIPSLVGVAGIQHRAGMEAPALATLQEAADVARSRKDPAARRAELARLVPIFVQYGGAQEARALYREAGAAADGFPDNDPRGPLMAAALVLGELDVAVEMARALPGSEAWRGLSRIARVAAKAGDRRQAEALLREAEALCRGLSPDQRASALAETAFSYAEAGSPAPARELLREAQRIAEGLPDPLARTDALTQVPQLVVADYCHHLFSCLTGGCATRSPPSYRHGCRRIA
ncbi:MAG: tetratricopeptide repeat protein, partial [Armatimonadota bacterium]